MYGWMDEWLEALADEVHKQEIHISQHCYITIPTYMREWQCMDIDNCST